MEVTSLQEIVDKMNTGEIQEFSDVENVADDRLYYEGISSIKAKAKMYECLQQTINLLSESPYCDKERIYEHQYNIITAILSSYLKGHKTFILEAPTGVGKSIIAVIVSETIRRYMGTNQNGYVLTSSKMLQDQMERDSKNFNLRWAVLKGQSNYQCLVNGKTFAERDCSDYSIPKAIELLQCSKKCGYIQARMKAVTWNTAILSYSYWLTTMNFVYETAGNYAPFGPREITVFDECHSLSDVVQGMFQQVISTNMLKRFTLIHDLLLQCNIKEDVIMWSLSYMENIKIKFNKILDEKLSVNDMFDKLVDFTNYIGTYSKVLVGVCNKYLPPDAKEWIAPQRKLDSLSEQIRKWWMELRYFINENESCLEYIVKTYQKDKLGNTIMTLRTLNEQSLIKEHVHKYCKFQLFMSATIGDADVFASNIGVDDYESMYIESSFDYTKSPIYTVNPPISLGMKHKSQNMQELLYRIVHLCEKHQQERGIIHTGNFEIARNLKEFIWEHSNTPRRFLFYNDAFQKAEAIKKLQKQRDAIIVGPSLTEGLDLKDDYCRFMILAKVPYPILDDFNSKKMKIMPSWYGWKTVTTIIQSLGRGIRNKKDWCVTYLLDSCFSLIFQKERVPRYITSRMRSLNIGMLQRESLNMMNEVDGLFNYKEAGGIEVPKQKETLDTIDIDAMLNGSDNENKDKNIDNDDKEEWDDLPF